MASVFTIGHSSHEWRQFAALLGAAEITALADVRSSPSSRYPHFSRAALKAGLNAAGIEYRFLGVELGGRPRCGGPGRLRANGHEPALHDGARSDRRVGLAQPSRPDVLASMSR